MRGIVHRCFVQENKVLIRSTAPHIDAGTALVAFLDARHQLKSFEQVLFPKQHGDLLNLLRGQFDFAHLNLSCLPADSIIHDLDFLEVVEGLHFKVEPSAAIQVQAQGPSLETHVTDLQVVGTRG